MLAPKKWNEICIAAIPIKNADVKKKYLIAAGISMIAGAAYVSLRSKKTIPKGIAAVTGFKKEKYLGKWYEIARLEYQYEKNLANVSAEYSLNNDGSIRVYNCGYNFKKDKIAATVGKAKFVGDESVGQLKVSFFGPFYAGYNVIAIDEEYEYALVAGDSRDSLWLLSREKTMPGNIINKYLDIAAALGFPVEDLVWTKQDISIKKYDRA